MVRLHIRTRSHTPHTHTLTITKTMLKSCLVDTNTLSSQRINRCYVRAINAVPFRILVTPFAVQSQTYCIRVVTLFLWKIVLTDERTCWVSICRSCRLEARGVEAYARDCS